MHTTWNEMPMADCPHCGVEQQLDDYYDFEPGDYRDCKNCGRTMHVVETDTTMRVTLATESA